MEQQERNVYIEELGYECDLNSGDLEDRLCELLDDYCETLSKEEGMTRQPGKEEYVGEYDPVFLWTNKAARKIENEISVLWSIAAKYLTEEEMDDVTIETNWYKEVE